MPANPAALASLEPYKWKKGQSGNPSGPKPGFRKKFEAMFLQDLQSDWRDHGMQAIEAARAKDPVGYLRVIASLMPPPKDEPFDGLARDELRAAIDAVRALIAAADAGGDGAQAGHAGAADRVPALSQTS